MKGSISALSGLFAAAIAFAGFLPSAQAREIPDSPEYKRCMLAVDDHLEADGSRWPAVGACNVDELARLNRRLNSLYGSVLAQSRREDPPVPEKLVAAERQWIAFRDAWCEFDSWKNPAPYPQVAKPFCLIDMTKEHIERLSNELTPEDQRKP